MPNKYRYFYVTPTKEFGEANSFYESWFDRIDLKNNIYQFRTLDKGRLSTWTWQKWPYSPISLSPHINLAKALKKDLTIKHGGPFKGEVTEVTEKQMEDLILLHQL
jgi:hypothetical protein